MTFGKRTGGVVIVVDTSVWIDAHRRPTSSIAKTLKGLLDADEAALVLPVRLELAAGVSRRDRPALLRALYGLPLVRPSDDTWRVIEQWVPAAADKGHRFGLSDWLIAALTSEIGALVWSLDEDFAKLERLTFVRRYDASVL
jgi:predicted nucleic acid-binding protein